jgi:hypothetical protein
MRWEVGVPPRVLPSSPEMVSEGDGEGGKVGIERERERERENF